MLILATLLMSATALYAQGDDFPFPGAPPPWDNPGPNLIPGGTILGQKVTSGTIGQASQVINVKGDSVIVRYVQDFRDPVPLLVRIASDGARSMTWVGGDDWQGWGCLRWCEWEVVTSAPNIQLWIEFVGIRGTFGAHLEIEEVKRGPVITKAQKDAASKQQAWDTGWSIGLSAASPACGVLIGAAGDLCKGIFATTIGLFAAHAYQLGGTISDPWDPLYFVLYDGYWPPESDFGMFYVDEGDDPWGVASNINNAITTIRRIAFYLDMIVVTGNRFASAQMAGNDYWANQQYWRGKWAIDQLVNEYWNLAWYLEQIQYVLEQQFDPWLDLGNGHASWFSELIGEMVERLREFAEEFAN
jgi:hypothetical protein